MAKDFVTDIEKFHEKFGIGYQGSPRFLSEDLYQFRFNHIEEELEEFRLACETGTGQFSETERLAFALDGLIDLVYVAIGTAHMMGLPFREGWDLVQAANMKKVRAAPDGSDSKRGHGVDVIKPPGWTAPDLVPLLTGVIPAVERRKVVTLCGSTRFKQEFIQANFEETMRGNLVLTVGFFSHADDQQRVPTPEEKLQLDETHKRKIDISDEILVINKDGYIGDSTRSEIEYAERIGVPVKYLYRTGHVNTNLWVKQYPEER